MDSLKYSKLKILIQNCRDYNSLLAIKIQSADIWRV